MAICKQINLKQQLIVILIDMEQLTMKNLIEGLVAPGKLTESIQSLSRENEINSNSNENEESQPLNIQKNMVKVESLEQESRPGTTTTNTAIQTKRIRNSHDDFVARGKSKQAQLQSKQRLASLRKQHRQIKNIRVEQQQNQSESKNHHENRKGSEYSKSQIFPKNFNFSPKMKESHRDYSLVQYERRQWELIAANHITKIEELLRSEAQYKRKIFELSKNNAVNPYENQMKELVDKMQQQQRINSQLLQKFKYDFSRYAQQKQQLELKIKDFQIKNIMLEIQVKKLREQVSKLSETIALQKQQNLNEKLQIKHIEIEKQMIEKQRKFQKQRHKKTIDHLTKDRDNLFNIINALQTEIKKLCNQKSSQNKKQNKCQCVKINKAEERWNQQMRDNETLINELKSIKNSIQNMKQKKEDKREQKNELEVRIANLQKKINQQNYQKSVFLQELNRIVKDFQDLQNQNDKLREKLRQSERLGSPNAQVIEQEKLHKSNQKQQQVIRHINSYKYQFDQNFRKYMRIESQNSQLKQKIIKLQQEIFRLESRAQDKIYERDQKYEILQSQNEMNMKRINLEMSIAITRYKAEIQLLREEKLRLNDEINRMKLESLSQANQQEQKIQNIRKSNMEQIRSYQQQLRTLEQETQRIRRFNQNNIISIQQQHERQLTTLFSRIQQLSKCNQHYAIENVKLAQCQFEKSQLQYRIKKMGGLNINIDHLWFIKQAQYQNINEILKHFKQA